MPNFFYFTIYSESFGTEGIRIERSEERKVHPVPQDSNLPSEPTILNNDRRNMSGVPKLPPIYQPHIQTDSIGTLPPIRGSRPYRED